ncbi:putative non-specific serine/threonine protein kinase [Rosa chinensis]|uniref:Putative non-specific serine/threonine protein kinase n=1 Tax=Rosa chinensis TaxID=74649 RepID=A0A2P6SLM7_ROSCH|nr:putative non-specific serine/threonine protein kinase [Rosa chinensis]
MQGLMIVTTVRNNSLLDQPSLNAFDIISLSSGLDLSGLFKICLVRLVSVCSSKLPATLS